MQRAHAVIVGWIAALAIAGMPAVSGASVITTAQALHTGVSARPHSHHGHSHHTHHARGQRAELRAEPASHTHTHASHQPPAAPERRAPHPHAMLPHAGTQLHRSQPQGGAPYALGLASLSLGLSTRGDAMPESHNEQITDPSSGILKGRSPPRGIPLSATCPPCPARPAAHLRAPADPIRDCRLVPASPASRHDHPHTYEACVLTRASGRGPIAAPVVHRPNPAPLARGFAATPDRAFQRGLLASFQTPDRASEGRTAGSLLPSWRSDS
jgi:hypothetical protein